MKLIVGLGNPQKEYLNTLHNAGYLFLDSLLKIGDIEKDWRKDSKLDCLFIELKPAESTIIFNKIKDLEKEDYKKFINFFEPNLNYIFAKPTTGMNLSGRSVRKLIKEYSVKLDNLLVVHDDIDQSQNKSKYVEKGGSGGQNGVKDILNKLELSESKKLKRLKIGIAPSWYNPSKHKASQVVLKPFDY